MQNCKRRLALRRVAKKSRKERDLMMAPSTELDPEAGTRGGRIRSRKKNETAITCKIHFVHPRLKASIFMPDPKSAPFSPIPS